jgi:hypothetical protein
MFGTAALRQKRPFRNRKLAICPQKPSLSPFTSRRERHEEDDKNAAYSTEIKISFGNEVCVDQTYRGQIMRAATSA